MTALPKPRYITEEEYRAGEEISTVKREWLDGQVYAMAGGTYNHKKISTNVCRAAQNALQGRSCDAHNSDQRIRLSRTDKRFIPMLLSFVLLHALSGRAIRRY